jgi:hypothetical protein
MTTPEAAGRQQPAGLPAEPELDDLVVQLQVVVDGTRFAVTGFDSVAQLQAAVRAAIEDQSVLELRIRDDENRLGGVLLLAGAQLSAVAVLGQVAPPLGGRPGID